MDSYSSAIRDFKLQLSLKRITLGNIEKLGRGGKPDAILVIGMGGSGLVGTLLQKISGYAKVNIPLITSKDFGLPSIPYARNPLYLFVSFSGNTKETLDGFKKAVRLKKAKIAVIAGGGKLLALAKSNKLPFATFPQGNLEPRQDTGAMLYGALGILRSIWKAIPAPDLSSLKSIGEESLGRALAQKIGTKFPLIYTSTRFSHVGYYWKIQLNETAKTLAIANTIPEIDHNEVVALGEHPKDVIVLFIENAGETGLSRKSIAITKQVLKKFDIPTITVTLPGKTPLETTIYGLLIGEWTSYYLSQIKEVNPRQINIINEIKKANS